MVSIKAAVQSAIAFATENLGLGGSGGLQLEEIESGRANGDDTWLITLSMPNPSGLNFFGPNARAYKVFAVLKSDGQVVSMKIRELAER